MSQPEAGDAAAPATFAVARAVVEALSVRRQTLAVAESITGGLLAASIVDVAGASKVFRGGLIVYATDLKVSLAGAPADLVAARGPVDPDVATALASGATRVCGADWGVATTGVAGPDRQDGVAVGTVYVAVHGPDVVRALPLRLDGGRAMIRSSAVAAALSALAEALA